jgi:NADH-quinone oxidoreductase subunit K
MIPLSWYLIFAALLFAIGLFGVITRKNSVAILMSVELMLNAVNINLLAFWHFHTQNSGLPQVNAMVFVAIVFIAAAAEAAVGLALIISVYRQRRTVVVPELDTLKG